VTKNQSDLIPALLVLLLSLNQTVLAFNWGVLFDKFYWKQNCSFWICK